jgi:hypothetical protein
MAHAAGSGVGVVGVLALTGMLFSLAGCATQEVSPLGDADLWEDGRTLSLSIPSCNAEEITAEVEETDTAVTITVSVTNPDDGSECLDSTIIELDEPLGSRTLIDGTTDDEITVRPRSVEGTTR